MAGEETLIFWIGAAGFGIATLMFALISDKKSENPFRTELFVSFISSLSYLIMATGIATVIGPGGESIYWSRWLFYIASCSILTADIALLKGKSPLKILEVAIFTGLTMFSGFLGSYLLTLDRWWFYALGSVAYIALLVELNRGPPGKITQMPVLIAFVSITWSLFPVVWVLAPTGLGLINTFTEVILYGILDIVTKTLFGLYLTFKIK